MLKLTQDNYYTPAANQAYMSVSQYKRWMECEAAAMAEVNGDWQHPDSEALLLGSYVDAYFEGTISAFCQQHPEIFKKNGTLMARYKQADEAIIMMEADPVFMRYMAGQKQVIMTAHLFGVDWKIKMDSYHPGEMIVDLKYMAKTERVMGRSFVEYWGYDVQMAIYSAVEAANSGTELPTFLAVATKQDPPDKEIVEIPAWRRVECLADVARNMPHILAVKAGKKAPERCGVCAYCRATKVLDGPVDYDMVGFTTRERRAILEGVF